MLNTPVGSRKDKLVFTVQQPLQLSDGSQVCYDPELDLDDAVCRMPHAVCCLIRRPTTMNRKRTFYQTSEQRFFYNKLAKRVSLNALLPSSAYCPYPARQCTKLCSLPNQIVIPVWQATLAEYISHGCCAESISFISIFNR